MEWALTIAKTLDRIEENLLSEELTLGSLCREAALSESHLQRAFNILTGMSIVDYIRRRRLTLAAQELATTDNRVIDVALKYLYETPEAFNKAFRRHHGISPVEARRPGVTLNACTRLSIEIHVKGAPNMNYKLLEKEAFKLIGKTLNTTTENGANLREIPEFWSQLNQNGEVEKMIQIPGIRELVGACIMEDITGQTFDYSIAAMVDQETEVPEGMDVYEVPPLTWAVFECIGAMPDAIQNGFKQIYSEWFPSTGYEHAPGPELEVYPKGNPMSEDYYSEIWVPIIKK